MVSSCLSWWSVVHLPKFGSQCEELCENYKNQKSFGILETPVILMPKTILGPRLGNERNPTFNSRLRDSCSSVRTALWVPHLKQF